MSVDPFKTKLPELNPLDRRMPADDKGLSPNAGPDDVARAGYRVLDRADPSSPYTPSRRGMNPPVYDYPMPDDY